MSSRPEMRSFASHACPCPCPYANLRACSGIVYGHGHGHPYGRAGFTLLEVMVAVVILAVGLSSLFTSEAGAIRLAQRARTTTVATLLARCKMAEVEEKIAKEGFPATGMSGRDECCEDAEHDGYDCEWKVDRIVMPGELGGEDSAATGGMPNSPANPTTDPASAVGMPIGDIMGGGGGGGDAISSMLLETTFPLLKPVIEEQVRRATVTVSWKEGGATKSFDVVQFIVNENEFVAPDDEEGGGPGGTPGGGTTGGLPGGVQPPNFGGILGGGIR